MYYFFIANVLSFFVCSRLHQLPWIVEVTLEYPQGRTMQILAETFVHTVPQVGDSKFGNVRNPILELFTFLILL